jgi:hypothetical protein
MSSPKRSLVVRRVGARPHVVRVGQKTAHPPLRTTRPAARSRVPIEHDGTRPIRPNERDD